MVTLHATCLVNNETLSFHPSTSPFQAALENNEEMLQVLLVAKLFATNAKKAAAAFTKRMGHLFDPIVRENSCQIRALAVVEAFGEGDLDTEAKELLKSATKVEKSLNRLIGKVVSGRLQFAKTERPFASIIDEFDLGIPASARMAFLVQAHLLSVGKIFGHTAQGAEFSGIDIPKMQNRLGVKQLSKEIIEEIVRVAQGVLAETSIVHIQEVARRLGGFESAVLSPQLADGATRAVQGSNPHLARSSCALFNFTTILVSLSHQQRLLMVRENGSVDPLGTLFRAPKPGHPFAPLSLEEMEQLDDSLPVFVVEGFMPGGSAGFSAQLEEVESLEEALLVNAALIPQFKIDGDDEEPLPLDATGRTAVLSLRGRAESLGCSFEARSRRFFTITHTHAQALSKLRQEVTLFELASGGAGHA